MVISPEPYPYLPSLASTSVRITDRHILGRIGDALNKAARYNPNHPSGAWHAQVTVEFEKESLVFKVTNTNNANGTLLYLTNPVGMNIGTYRSDDLAVVLEQAVASPSTRPTATTSSGGAIAGPKAVPVVKHPFLEILGMVLRNIGIVLILLINVIWYQGKIVLRRKGYPASYFFSHGNDFQTMDKAIAEEKNPQELARLRVIRRRMGAIGKIAVVAFISFLGGIGLMLMSGALE